MSRRRRHITTEDPSWSPWQTDDARPGLFFNNVYEVVVHEGRGLEGDLTLLSVRRHDGRATREWRDMQRIKNDLCGREREGCELYPAESRMVDVANFYHLFVLPAGTRFPFGDTEGHTKASQP